ncbi:MAG: hypothetical protein H6741_10600 [Alphaproteobacteria bacterium]|nr:hypothetical protein [Alphaproteobacteria bacterium]
MTTPAVVLHNLETHARLALPSPPHCLTLEGALRWDSPSPSPSSEALQLGPLLRGRLGVTLEGEEGADAMGIKQRWLDPLRELLSERRAWGTAALPYPPRVALLWPHARYLIRLERFREQRSGPELLRCVELTLHLKMRELRAADPQSPSLDDPRSLAALLGPPSRDWWND